MKSSVRAKVPVGMARISRAACMVSRVVHLARMMSSSGGVRLSCEHRSRTRFRPSVSLQVGDPHCVSNHISCTMRRMGSV
eukprot:6631487-Prymnesium_polylepis.1